MMPLSTFNILMTIVVVLVLYSLIDNRNKLYGNIVAAILASIVGTLLAILIYIGAIEVDTGIYTSDTPTAAILILISIAIAIYAFFMIMDAKEEYERAAREENP